MNNRLERLLTPEGRTDIVGGLLHLAVEMGAVLAVIGFGALVAWLLLLG